MPRRARLAPPSPARPPGRLIGALLLAAGLLAPASALAMPVQEGRLVDVPVRGESIKAYVVRPLKAGLYPGVVILHEWWGLNDQIKGVANRLAGAGYVAIVPDLYHGKIGTDAGLARDLMRGLDHTWAVEVVKDAAGYLRQAGGARPQGQRMPIGILGFCMGGGITLEAALGGADVQGVVMFYGHVDTDKKDLATLKAPLLGIFGNEDRGVPLDQIKTFEAALKATGKKATILVYPGVGHAFFNEERPGYDREAAGDAWERTKQFFRKNLTAEAAAPKVQARPRRPHLDQP